MSSIDAMETPKNLYNTGSKIPKITNPIKGNIKDLKTESKEESYVFIKLVILGLASGFLLEYLP